MKYVVISTDAKNHGILSTEGLTSFCEYGIVKAETMEVSCYAGSWDDMQSSYILWLCVALDKFWHFADTLCGEY